MGRSRDPIRKVELKGGEIRYEFVIDVGRRPDGGRDQRRFRYRTHREAKAERARIIAERVQTTYVARSKVTIDELIDRWLSKKRNITENSRYTYQKVLLPVRQRVGWMRAQELDLNHLDDLVDWMQASGRRLFNKTRSGLQVSTVNYALSLLSQVLNRGIREGVLSKNVVNHVERPTTDLQERKGKRRKKKTWTAGHAQMFLDYTTSDRLTVAWELSSYGLRRGEVLGLRREDCDLSGVHAMEREFPEGTPSIYINNQRICVGYVVVEDEPKTPKSERCLPLDVGLVNNLARMFQSQDKERDEAGDAYAGLCDLCGGVHVVVDELGRAYHPKWYSNRFARLATLAGVPRISLHDVRHTCGTLMHLRGVPIAVISAWLGHAKVSFTLDTYVHEQGPGLVSASDVLAEAIRPHRGGPNVT